MAQFQHMNGKPLNSTITAVVGNSIPLKLIPGPKEPLLEISVSPDSIAKISRVDKRTRANFTTFHLDAVALGKATLKATGSRNGPVAGPINVVVEAAIELSPPLTNRGLLERVFLAEVSAPDPDAGYTLEKARQAMRLMRVVIENRLKNPSVEWASAGATSMLDVIRAEGQFRGFPKYPTIGTEQQRNINDAVKIANNADDSRQQRYRDHVNAAREVAQQPSPVDPTQRGLYWWRTYDSGAPDDAIEYKTILGNTFYTR